MDFKSSYNYFHTKKLDCNLKKFMTVKKIAFGSGGSDNIIIIGTDKSKKDLVVKVMPKFVHHNAKVKPNYNQIETAFYKFFTQKYLLTDRTPNIVGIYNHKKCHSLRNLLKNIIPPKFKCPTYEEELLQGKYTIPNSRLCGILLQTEFKMFESDFEYMMVEYCQGDLGSVIRDYVELLKKTSGDRIYDMLGDFLTFLLVIFFQVIFTLAIIQDDYPTFHHSDFFLRNLLYVVVDEHAPTDLVAYHYGSKTFYLPANGIYVKINDFGRSTIIKHIEPNTFDINNPVLKYYHFGETDLKSDIFNFFHDIYDGENLGAESLNALFEELKLQPVKTAPVKKLLARFIDTKVIDKINDKNRSLLNKTWSISGIKILEKSVKTPREYLTKGAFKEFEVKPTSDARIVMHYNLKV
jgi:hypothetical protein